MPKQSTDTTAVLAELRSRLDELVAAARDQGRAEALEEVRSVLSGNGAPAPRTSRTPRRPRTAPVAAPPARKRAKRKNSWVGLTPEQRLKRVNAIRKGKGLKPRRRL